MLTIISSFPHPALLPGPTLPNICAHVTRKGSSHHGDQQPRSQVLNSKILLSASVLDLSSVDSDAFEILLSLASIAVRTPRVVTLFRHSTSFFFTRASPHVLRFLGMLPGCSSVWTWCFPLPCCAHSYGFNILSKRLISKLAFHPSSLLSFRLPFQKPTGHLYPMVTQAHQLIPNWWLSKYFYLTHPKMLKQNTWHLRGSSLPRLYTYSPSNPIYPLHVL